MKRECNVSLNDAGDMVVDFFERKESQGNEDTPTYLQEVKCHSYESRICALADIQRWVIQGELREYDNDYQRYNRWTCIYCGSQVVSINRENETVCSHCKKPRISNLPMEN